MGFTRTVTDIGQRSNHRPQNRRQLMLFRAGVNDGLMTGRRNKYPRFPRGFATNTPAFRSIPQ
jgi:hypothetical protein